MDRPKVQIATTVEQSRKLYIDYNIDPITASFVLWKLKSGDEWNLEVMNWTDCINKLRRKGLVGFDETEIDVLPAWGFTDLLRMLPHNYPTWTWTIDSRGFIRQNIPDSPLPVDFKGFYGFEVDIEAFGNIIDVLGFLDSKGLLSYKQGTKFDW